MQVNASSELLAAFAGAWLLQGQHKVSLQLCLDVNARLSQVMRMLSHADIFLRR